MRCHRVRHDSTNSQFALRSKFSRVINKKFTIVNKTKDVEKYPKAFDELDKVVSLIALPKYRKCRHEVLSCTNGRKQ